MVMIPNGLALIFDMDGVIVDSNPIHREAWRHYNRRFGLETTDLMIERMYGKRNDEIIREYFGSQLSDEEVIARGAAKEELYREMIAEKLESALVKGLNDVLQCAQNSGTPVGLATNAERANVDFVLYGAQLRSRFRAIVDGQQVERPKPYPDIYLETARLLGMRPADCIVFEDSFSGVEAARAAGMRVVGVRTTHAEFECADLEIDDFQDSELPVWLECQQPSA